MNTLLDHSWDYGLRSTQKLNTCHKELIDVFHLYRQRQYYEITIVHGWRGERVQNDAFFTEASTKQWPNSKHNTVDKDGTPLSDAVDFAPWIPGFGIPWKDSHAFSIIGGLLLACSVELGYNCRYGGDWDMDGQTTDQLLMDWGHIERLL